MLTLADIAEKPGITKRNALTITRRALCNICQTKRGIQTGRRAIHRQAGKLRRFLPFTSLAVADLEQYARGAGTEYLQPLNPCYKTMQMDDGVQIIGRVVDAKLPKSLF